MTSSGKLTSTASSCDLLRFPPKYSRRGPETFQAWSPEPELLSVAFSIKSLKGRELIDRRAKYSREIVDKLQIYANITLVRGPPNQLWYQINTKQVYNSMLC